MSQTKTGKTKSVQVSDAGYARVMETARQLRMTRSGRRHCSSRPRRRTASSAW